MHCASLLRTIFTSLAPRANKRVHVHNERNFPQAKLDSRKMLSICFKMAADDAKVWAYLKTSFLR